MIANNWTFLGAVSIGIATSAYIFFGPSGRKKSKRKDVCPGLENLGNTCFLNSILQAWAACPSVVAWLTHFLKRQASQGNKQDYLASSVSNVLKVLNLEKSAESDPYSPVEVLTALKLRRWVISPDEQDAHELFQALTQTLDEETSRYPSVVSLFDIGALQSPANKYQPEGVAANRSGGLLPVLPHREYEQPFRGLLASQLSCQTCCYHYPVKYDLFDSLSLSIPTSFWGPLSLDKLLCHFICPETVTSVHCPGCSKESGDGSSVKSNFRKKLTIGKLPQVLCVHIQRTQWLNNSLPVKRFDYISFPEVLVMDEYVYTKAGRRSMDNKHGLLGGKDATLDMLRFGSNHPRSVSTSAPVNLLRTLNFDSHATRNSGLLVSSPGSVLNSQADYNHNSPNLPKAPHSDFTYRLSAVVSHLGDVFSGHFVTFRRAPTPGQPGGSERWLYTSDTTVKKATAAQVMGSEAYMLFYERV